MPLLKKLNKVYNMKKLQKVWAELSKANKGTKLSSNKRNVKLSLIDDIESLMDYTEETQSTLSYFTYEIIGEQEEKLQDISLVIDEMIINSEMLNAKDSAEELGELLEKVEESAKGLGMDADEVFDRYDEAKELVQNTISTHDDLVSEWRSSRLQNVTAFADKIK
tara:strand:- start:5310 stop:5804 length:495 start_codon:yes stop_codon:yes gene_type:complete